MELDLILYTALISDPQLKELVGDRVKSTCFEVAPTEQDNVELPYIIVTDDGFQNQDSTKDDTWESEEDMVQSSIEISGRSPREVKILVALVRMAINRYINNLYEKVEDVPELSSLTSDGLAWDWTKPCYFQTLTYRCFIKTDNDYE
jgi:hypothetical protein